MCSNEPLPLSVISLFEEFVPTTLITLMRSEDTFLSALTVLGKAWSHLSTLLPADCVGETHNLFSWADSQPTEPHSIKIKQNGIQRKQTSTIPLQLNTSRFQQVNYLYLTARSHFIDFSQIKEICTAKPESEWYKMYFSFILFFCTFSTGRKLAQLHFLFFFINASHLIHALLYILRQSFHHRGAALLFSTYLTADRRSSALLEGILMAVTVKKEKPVSTFLIRSESNLSRILRIQSSSLGVLEASVSQSPEAAFTQRSRENEA